MTLDFFSILRCPLTREPLTREGETLVSPSGARYPIVHDIPVLLAPNTQSTLWVKDASLEAAWEKPNDPWQVDTIGLSPEQRNELKERLKRASSEPVDPIISFLVGATSGYMYSQMAGNLDTIPIPSFRLQTDSPRLLLDVGCNWGRWMVAASRAGFVPIGLDPSLGAVLAAKRLCKKFGIEAHFVVGDALQLPFKTNTFDTVFSYSVVQHFSKENAAATLRQLNTVAKPGAEFLVQMPNMLGVRCLYHQARRRFRNPTEFDVRYYSPAELLEVFTDNIGPSRLDIDGFFGLGIQPSDRALMPWLKRQIIDGSESLRKLSTRLPLLKFVADSLYVQARKAAA